MGWLIVLLVFAGVVAVVVVINQEAESSSSPSPPFLVAPAAGGEHEFEVRLDVSIGGSEQLREPWSNSRACWKSQGQEAMIGSYAIRDGWIYVGENLPSVLRWGGLEPALIDPSLPRDDANPDSSGDGLSYWPAYSSVSPSSRSAYLEWLADGRSAPDAFIGYVFLYFFGIERRVLADTENSATAREEVPLLTSEVRRLLSIYGKDDSFDRYATSFLEFVELRSETWEPTPEPPGEMPDGGDLPLTLRLGVGHMAIKGSPLPCEWALAWVRRDMNIYLRMPALRCREEFDELFRVFYQEKYGSGLRLKVCKRKVSIHYGPASPSFLGLLEVSTQIPDVTSLVGPRRKLHELATKCSDALDAYSRWLGRNPDGRGSLLSAALLPPELLANRAPEEFAILKGALEDRISDQPVVLLHSEEVLDRWFEAGSGKLTKNQAVQAAHLIGRAGFGFEPDVRFCGKKPDKDGQIAVFRLTEVDNGSPSAEYSAAAVWMHLAVMVSAADGDVSFDEKRHMRDHLATGLSLAQTEVERLGAYLEWLLANPPSRLGGKKKLERLASAQRRTIGKLLISVACADGRIEPQEVKMLTGIFRFLDLDPGNVHDWLHTHQASGNDGPVSVVSANHHEGPPGFSLPKRPEDSGEVDRVVKLDPVVLAAKLRDSERAAVTLASIFVDEEDEMVPMAPLSIADTHGNTIEGLDGSHSMFLEKLAERPSWSRANYESLADEFGVLPDGALDLLNDTAFELCEEPVIEGYDPLEISSTVVHEMLASREIFR